MDGPRLGTLGLILYIGVMLVIGIALTTGEPTGYAILKSSLTKTGNLYVSSNPKGANVYVDNVYKGTTPTTISLSTGSHDVKVTKSGYNDYISTATISSGTTTNFDVTLPLPQSKLGIKTTSPTQVSDIPSPYPAERQQDIRKKSNATPQLTATVPPPQPKQASDSGGRVTATAPPLPPPATARLPAKNSIWYALYSQYITGHWYSFSIATLNLGSEARICTTFKTAENWDTGEYYSSCSWDAIGPGQVHIIGMNDARCFDNDPGHSVGGEVPCSGYIKVYSEDTTQPILPSGTFCTTYSDYPSWAPECILLHFYPESDIIG